MPVVVLTIIFWNVLFRTVDGYARLDMDLKSPDCPGERVESEHYLGDTVGEFGLV